MASTDLYSFLDLCHCYKLQHSTGRISTFLISFSDSAVLAAWFRLKYPHVALGALASSAPILYFDDITPQDAYYSVVTRDFREESETCYQTILNSWSEIDRVASMPNGLSILSEKFKTCTPLNRSSELTVYLRLMYADAAQYNDPQTQLVAAICKGIDEELPETDLLGKIFAGVVAYTGNISCYINSRKKSIPGGWQWQRCSEMVMPIGTSNNTMFPPYPFNLSRFISQCNSIYGVPPRPHWVTTYYGGHDIKLILKRFASNIIFSNGLKDPYSSGGVLKNISGDVVAVYTVNGSHCLDILLANETTDPDWLKNQRKTEVDFIERWIAEYYDDLQKFKQ